MPDISLAEFKDAWLESVEAGTPSAVELGRRFAHKLICQWLQIDDRNDEIIYCDGSGDGGVDVAYLLRGENDPEDGGIDAANADVWYLVQSKYGSAFRGTSTVLEEGHKVLESLDGARSNLSSLADGLIERLRNFRRQASERDRIVLVFAAVDPPSDETRRAISDVRAMGRQRLGPIFDVEIVTLETLWHLALEEDAPDGVTATLCGSFVKPAEDLWVGTVSLVDLYNFLKAYKASTGDLDRLYEMNVRRFLGGRGRVNRAMQATLKENPELFGLYNNGITFVVADCTDSGNGFGLNEPYIVNGCQTTRTIWDVLVERLDAGGQGEDTELREWEDRVRRGVVVTKIVRVRPGNEGALESITRFTNNQNTIREKDFLALNTGFRSWARALGVDHELFLEIQRGGWDSQRAFQRAHPDSQQFAAYANAFDLMKVYGSGWLREPGAAYGRNGPFLPGGTIFARIAQDSDGEEQDSFGVDELYAAYELEKLADGLGFGRSAQRVARKQTRFLFYYTFMDLLRHVVGRIIVECKPKDLTKALLALFREENAGALSTLTNAALEVVDSYLSSDVDDSLFREPAFVSRYNNDLNSFLKWEQLGKGEEFCPRLANLLALHKAAMGMALGGSESPRDLIASVAASALEGSAN